MRRSLVERKGGEKKNGTSGIAFCILQLKLSAIVVEQFIYFTVG